MSGSKQTLNQQQKLSTQATDLFKADESAILNTTQSSSINLSTSLNTSLFDTSLQMSQQQYQPNFISTKELKAEQPPVKDGIFSKVKLDQIPDPRWKTIPLKEIIDLSLSKREIYRAFTQKGQLYLPPISMCNFAFYTGILTGNKMAFTTSEIVIAQVPQYKELSVEKVYAIALTNSKVMKYMPDSPDGSKLDAKRIDRAYLFNVMNTIDKRFFPRAVTEIEENLVKTDLKSDGVLKVNQAMFYMLKEYVQTHKIKHNKRSTIALVKQSSKKRKRPQLRDSIELETQFAQENVEQRRTH